MNSYAELFSAWSTFALFLTALIVYITDVCSKKTSKIREQAEQISAWNEGEVKRNGMITITAMLNQSKNPVHHVITTIVAFQGAGSKDGRKTIKNYQSYLRILPPGEYYTFTDGDYGGMNFQPAVEIAFMDQAGKYWVREGEGKLKQIKVSLEKYYDLDTPINWGFPQKDKK